MRLLEQETQSAIRSTSRSRIAAEMTNVECRMSNECRNTNDETLREDPLVLLSFVIGNSSFVIVPSSVALAHDKVQTAQHSGHVAHHATGQKFRQNTEIDKRWRANLSRYGTPPPLLLM